MAVTIDDNGYKHYTTPYSIGEVLDFTGDPEHEIEIVGMPDTLEVVMREGFANNGDSMECRIGTQFRRKTVDPNDNLRRWLYTVGVDGVCAYIDAPPIGWVQPEIPTGEVV